MKINRKKLVQAILSARGGGEAPTDYFMEALEQVSKDVWGADNDEKKSNDN